MSNTPTNNEKGISTYFTSFDGIRGTCCLLILLFHFHFTTFNLPSSVVYIGLHCFFIMSAFLITKNLLRDKERSTTFKECFKIFYVKRTARIFPLYIFYILLTIFLLVVFKFAFHSTFNINQELKKYGILLVTFTYNFKMLFFLINGQQADFHNCLFFPHLWSLSLEEQFYIVIIFLAWFANRKTLQIITLLFIVLMPIVRIIGYFWLSTKTQNAEIKTLAMWHLPFFQFDAFFYGIALTVFNFKKSKLYLYLFAAVFISIVSFGITNAYLCAKADGITIYTALREDQYFYRNYGYLFMDSLINSFCVLWFLVVLYFPEKFKVFTNKVFVRIGQLTYGLYIFQFLFLPLGLLLAGFFHQKLHFSNWISDAIGVGFYLLSNFAFSTFMYNTLEMPIVRFKDNYLKKMYTKKQ